MPNPLSRLSTWNSRNWEISTKEKQQQRTIMEKADYKTLETDNGRASDSLQAMVVRTGLDKERRILSNQWNSNRSRRSSLPLSAPFCFHHLTDLFKQSQKTNKPSDRRDLRFNFLYNWGKRKVDDVLYSRPHQILAPRLDDAQIWAYLSSMGLCSYCSTTLAILSIWLAASYIR